MFETNVGCVRITESIHNLAGTYSENLALDNIKVCL